MSAVVHFVAFSSDGVIESAASTSEMPGATDAVERGGERKPIVKSASGRQRFACGVEQSKWWGIKDDAGILHVASGEPERVSCAVCKQSKEYLNATGQLQPESKPSSQPAGNQGSQSDQQRAVNIQGTPEPVEPARPNDTEATG